MPENIDKGGLQINVTTSVGLIPIEDATITISFTGNPSSIVESVTTDSSGQTEIIEVPAPPIEYSMAPAMDQPYSEYNIHVNAPGFEPVLIAGTQVLPDVKAVQPIMMRPLERTEPNEVLVIPPHTLFGDFPPKIPEDEIKPMDESGQIVLPQVVIPEFVVVGI